MPLPSSSTEHEARAKSMFISTLLADASRLFLKRPSTTLAREVICTEDLSWAATSGGKARISAIGARSCPAALMMLVLTHCKPTCNESSGKLFGRAWVSKAP